MAWGSSGPAGEDLREEARRWLERKGVAARIRNRAFALQEVYLKKAGELGKKSAGEAPGDRYDKVRKDEPPALAALKRRWAAYVVDRLNCLANEAEVPLCRPANAGELDVDYSTMPSRRIQGRSWKFGPHSAQHYVYSATQLLEALTTRAGPEGAEPGAETANSHLSFHSGVKQQQFAFPTWSQIPICLRVPTLREIKKFFQEMAVQHRQVGVDDYTDGNEWYLEEREKQARAILLDGSIPTTRHFCKRGVPDTNRKLLWRAALGFEVTEQDTAYFESLCASVEESETLADYLVNCNMKSAVDSQHYFIFEEMIRTILRAFLQDTQVPAKAAQMFPKVHGKSQNGVKHGLYPPNGVVPFKGLVNYLAPLCMIHQHADECYFMFVALYCQHFSRLHTISEESMPSPGLPVLCNIFEELVHQVEPEVCYLMINLGVPPIKFALPWMANAFTTVFEPQDILVLWDRVIGHDSLLPFPVVAAGLIRFRRHLLLKAQTANEVRKILSDVCRLKPIVIMQELLASLSCWGQRGELTAGCCFSLFTNSADGPLRRQMT